MTFHTLVEPPEPMRGLEVPLEPAGFARAVGDDPLARAVYDDLAYSHKREHVRAESAKKPETRRRRIEKAIAILRG